MAFATSLVKQVNLGSVHALAGNWSAAAADTSGTIAVGGARILFAEFTNQDGQVGENSRMEWSASTSGTLTTITVNTSSVAVSTGRFLIVYD